MSPLSADKTKAGGRRGPSEVAAAVRLVGISLSYSTEAETVHALSNVSVSFQPGELTILRGVSGSGKSSLMGILAGLVTPDSGELHSFGFDLTCASNQMRARYRREIASLVFQEFNLLSALRVEENIDLALSLAGLDREQARRRAHESAELLGIGELMNRFPGELSGGQRQRVAVARAIASGKRLLLADEPTGSLDTHSGDLVVATLAAARDSGSAVIVATHDPRLVPLGDRVVTLQDGRIVHIRGSRE